MAAKKKAIKNTGLDANDFEIGTKTGAVLPHLKKFEEVMFRYDIDTGEIVLYWYLDKHGRPASSGGHHNVTGTGIKVSIRRSKEKEFTLKIIDYGWWKVMELYDNKGQKTGNKEDVNMIGARWGNKVRGPDKIADWNIVDERPFRTIEDAVDTLGEWLSIVEEENIERQG